MIRANVTLVLGAGASYPYGFPLGTPLKNDVIFRLSGNAGEQGEAFMKLLKEMDFDYKRQKEFARALHGSKQPSIDAFLQERRPEFLELGKAAIAALLIPHEYLHNLLLLEHELSNDLSGQRWYGYLLNLLGTYDEFCNNNLSIITFNYDRSLEYYLFHAIQDRFNIDSARAVEFMKSIPIVHFYGQLGTPDFLDPVGGRPYSSRVIAEEVKKCVGSMYLMYEPRDENEKNLERLKLRENLNTESIVATFYSMKYGEIERAKNLIHHYSPPNRQIIDYTYTVLEFLKERNYLT
jgi:hypothetical protein